MADTPQASVLSSRQLSGVIGSTLLTAMFAAWLAQAGGIVGASGVGIAILMAAFLIGVLIGFLFSVPRVLARDGGDAGSTEGASRSSGRRVLSTNTHLDRISDWLATLLVGVGLSQLGQINDGLLRFRQYIGEYHAGGNAYAPALEVVAPLLLLIGLTSGFLAMYLYTRIVLTNVLSRVESELDQPLPRGVQATVVSLAREARSEGATSDAVAFVADPVGPVTTGEGVNAMFDLLYVPEGYRRVIEIGEQLAATPAGQLVTYWFYLAAAYGQALSASQAASDAAGAEDARLKALNAAQRAITISPAYRNRLWTISNPDGEDNDLAALRDDPDFKRLVGR